MHFKDVFAEGSHFYAPWIENKGNEFYLHKLGHFIFYGASALFLFWKSSSIKRIILKLTLICGFAFIDEIHQYFVVGRSGRIMDVMFDIYSILLFLFLLLAFGIGLKANKSLKV